MPDRDREQAKRFWLERQRFPVKRDLLARIRPDRCSMPDQYSLNEAIRIRSMVSGHKGALKCPTCGGRMSGVAGGHGDGAVLLLGCDCCGRSLVLPKA